MIITTRSQGRTHIADELDYLGSVNSYNHLITRLFAKIFRKSIVVDFSGKKRSLNKKSYYKHLKTLGIASLDISHSTNYSAITQNLDLSATTKGKKMRDHIAPKDREKQSLKLARAIYKTKDENKACRAVYKGADPNTYFYLYPAHKQSLPVGDEKILLNPPKLEGDFEQSIVYWRLHPCIATQQNALVKTWHLLKKAGASPYPMGEKVRITKIFKEYIHATPISSPAFSDPFNPFDPPITPTLIPIYEEQKQVLATYTSEIPQKA